MVTTPKLGIRLMASNDLQKEVVFNEATVVLDTMVTRTAKARTNTPPVTPVNGDAYIVNTVPTGAWDGKANTIALYFNGWRFYTPIQKLKFFLEDVSQFWTYSGTAWSQDTAGTPLTLDDLTNVGGAIPTDGQVLTYNATTSLWEPVNTAAVPNLANLPDVAFNTLTDGQMIAWSEATSKWVNIAPPTVQGATSLGQLTDVVIAGAADGHLLTWDGGTSKAVFKAYAFPAAQLNDLTDVVTDTALINDVLAWNGASWVPSPAAITYSFLGMVDGPQTFTGYADHFLVVDATESFMTFKPLQELINGLTNFRLQDLTDVQVPADTEIDKFLQLKKTGATFNYVYTALPTWAVSFNDGATKLTDKIVSLRFDGFQIAETSEGGITVTAQNALGFEIDGTPVAEQVNAINFTGNGANVTNVAGLLTVSFNVPPPTVNLADLQDVDLVAQAPVDGNSLVYDGTALKWVPGAGSGGTGLVNGTAEPALYELGPFAPPTAGMFPLRHNAPSADLTEVKNRGLVVQPGPQTSGVKHGIVTHNIVNNAAPWIITARVVPSSFQVSGHAAGIVLQRAFNNAFAFLTLGNSNADTQHVLRFGYVSSAGVETVVLTEPNFYPWLRLGFDGNFIRAWVSADGIIWHNFSTPLDAATAVQGVPDRVGVTNRSNANHDGSVAALVTYWEDPDFPAAARIQNGYVQLSVSTLQDVDFTVPPTDGQGLVYNFATGTWLPGNVGGVSALGGLSDVDLVTTPPTVGQALVFNDVSGKWLPGTVGGASYPAMVGNTGKVLAVNATENGVEWVSMASGGGGGSQYRGDWGLDVSVLTWAFDDAVMPTEFMWGGSGGVGTIVSEPDVTGGTTNALRFAPITHAQNSYFDVAVTVPAGGGNLVFRVKVNSEYSDSFRLYVDGVQTIGIIGDVGTDYAERTQALAAGDHLLRFMYNKDASVSSGDDTAYLSKISVDAMVPSEPYLAGQIVKHNGMYWMCLSTGTASEPSAENPTRWTPLPGYLGVNAQVAAYTLVATDAFNYVRLDSVSPLSLVVPANATVAFPVGTSIPVRQVGAGQVTIAPDTGVTINTAETLRLRKVHSGASLIKVGTDEWDLVGDLELAP